MKELGRYDTDLQQFVEAPRGFKSMNHLRELRWRAERGEFGPKPLSVPRGELVFQLEVEEIGRYVQLEKMAKRPAFGLAKGAAFNERLRIHMATFGDY